jgi:RimJ/RimL family protein N-acetyltransferase
MGKNLFKKIKQLFNEKAPRSQKQYPVTIETPRLILRELEAADARRLLEITSTPGFKYYCFDGTQEKVADFLKDSVRSRATAADGNREEVMLAITLKDTGKLIGHVSLQRTSYLAGYPFDANFFVDPAYQSKGYGREAIINMKKYGYDEMGLSGYNITVHPDNKNSLAVFVSEGYKIVGQTTIKTVAGDEPRVLLLQTKDEFYARRKLDKRPLLLDNTKKAANENTPKPKGPKQG